MNVPIVVVSVAATALLVAATWVVGPALFARCRTRRDATATKEEAAAEAENQAIRARTIDYVAREVAATRAAVAPVQHQSEEHRSNADHAASMAQALQEEIGGEDLAPGRKVSRILALVIWVVAAAANLAMTYLLAFGITGDIVLSALIAGFGVFIVEAIAILMRHFMDKRCDAAELSSRAAMAGLVIFILAFCAATVYFASVRAVNTASAERISLENQIATYESDYLSADAARTPSSEDTLLYENAKDKLEALSGRIAQETILFAVFESAAVLFEFVLGTTIPATIALLKELLSIKYWQRRERRERMLEQRGQNRIAEMSQAMIAHLHDVLWTANVSPREVGISVGAIAPGVIDDGSLPRQLTGAPATEHAAIGQNSSPGIGAQSEHASAQSANSALAPSVKHARRGGRDL